MLITLLRQFELKKRLFQARNNPQRAELEPVYLEQSRVGRSPRAAIQAVKTLLREKRMAKGMEVAAASDFSNFVNVNGKRFLDFTPAEKMAVLEARDIALTTPQAVVSLTRAVQHVTRQKIPGALVECGVYMGGSVIAMIRTLQALDIDDRDVYLFDTFEGMPQPDDNDVFYTGDKANRLFSFFGGKGNQSNWVRADLESVKARVLATGYPEDRLHFIKGMVEDTIPRNSPADIALLRLDTDFYSSTKHELIHLYPLISPNGILILDDYGVFRGAQQATDEYFVEHDVGMFLNRVDEGVRLGVKA